MLVAGDVKGLEIVCAAELSKDPVLCKEIIDKEDIHGNNQKAFGLPSRLISKIFKFR
jgi:DNA polymerase I-like protein with 3'-5' exonuclease and polymerase domains